MQELLAKALSLHQQNKHDDAQKLYKDLLKLSPHDSNIMHLLAISYGQQGATSTAKQYIQQAILIQPESASYYNSYGNICKAEKNYIEAKEHYNKSITFSNNNPAAHYNLALILIDSNEYQARKHLVTALHYKNNYSDAYAALIPLYLQRKKYNCCRKLIAIAKEYSDNKNLFMRYEAQLYQCQLNHTEAIKILNRYILQAADDFKAHHHIAVSYLAIDDTDHAIEHNLAALKYNPDHAETCHNLATIYLTQNKLDLALKYWLQALSIDSNIDYYYNLGVVYNYQGKYSDSLGYFEKCLQLQDNHYNSIINIATLYLKKNMPTEAKFYYKKAAAIDNNDQQTQYMLAALESNNTNFTKSPPGYVSDLFDQYACSFDEHLTKVLSYSAPEKIYNLLVRHFDIENKHNLNVCDLGCGTGLMAEQLYQHCHNLIGIDLSKKMLAKAKQKNRYNKLIATDICKYLENNKNNFDLITAADVLPYYGELENIFQKIAQSLSPGGIFIASAEEYDHSYYKLASNARFSHNSSYMLQIAQKVGLKMIALERISTRKEASNDIAGIIIILQNVIT